MEPKAAKVNYIYQRMKQDIEGGRLLLGDRLFIEKIANDFGTTEECVHTVIEKLKKAGLVYCNSNMSVVVADISYKRTENILAIREVLESFAAKIAAQNIDEDGINILRKILVDMQRCFDSGDIGEYERLDRDFHATITEYSLNSELVRTINHFGNWQDTSDYKEVVTRDSLKTSLVEHHLIIEYLANKDGELAERMVYIHWRKHYDRARGLYKEDSIDK